MQLKSTLRYNRYESIRILEMEIKKNVRKDVLMYMDIGKLSLRKNRQ